MTTEPLHLTRIADELIIAHRAAHGEYLAPVNLMVMCFPPSSPTFVATKLLRAGVRFPLKRFTALLTEFHIPATKLRLLKLGVA